MDKELIEEAKKCPKENTSLSKLIKSYLQNLTTNKTEKDTEITPLVKSLSGVLSEEHSDYKKNFAGLLERKYK